MKIGTIALLVLAVLIVNPPLQMPASPHSATAADRSSPAPSSLRVHHDCLRGDLGIPRAHRERHDAEDDRRETDIRPIGYGAMLIEGLVGVTALIAASAMPPGDYFAINTTPATFANLGIPVVNLPDLEAAVGEAVAGRTGGAVSLAVGMAQIFSGLPGMRACSSTGTTSRSCSRRCSS